MNLTTICPVPIAKNLLQISYLRLLFARTQRRFIRVAAVSARNWDASMVLKVVQSPGNEAWANTHTQQEKKTIERPTEHYSGVKLHGFVRSWTNISNWFPPHLWPREHAFFVSIRLYVFNSVASADEFIASNLTK